jgi:hypothetical protein
MTFDQCVSQLVEIAKSGASEATIVEAYPASINDPSGTRNERSKLINAFRNRKLTLGHAGSYGKRDVRRAF